MLHGHGNDKYNISKNIIADFSSNVWYNPLPNWFYDQLSGSFHKITDYPHPRALDLVAELAVHYKLAENNIIATNGSVEGIFLIAQAFAGKKTAIIHPGFSEYEDACTRYKHHISYYSGEQEWHKNRFSEDIIFFGNPNNPNGKNISANEVEELVCSNPQSVVIIDEAFADLCINFHSAVSLLQKYENLIVLKSFTKAFAIPGIRLGCILANTSLIHRIENYLIPWSVNTFAIEAGKLIVRNYNQLLPTIKEQIDGNKYLHSKLNEIEELELTPSDCNFFLVKTEKCSVAKLREYLAHEYQFLIRNASNFRGLSDNYFRVSVQAEEHVDMLATGISNYFKKMHC